MRSKKRFQRWQSVSDSEDMTLFFADMTFIRSESEVTVGLRDFLPDDMRSMGECVNSL